MVGMSRSHNFRIVVVIFVSLVALISSSLAEEQKTPGKKSKRPPLLVTTVEVEEGTIQAMSDFVGTTYFSRVSQVATDIEGLVTKINFDEGDTVKKGDFLVQIEASGEWI